MKKQSIFQFYWFGTCMRYLQDASNTMKIHESSHILYNIDEFFKYLTDLELLVTQRATYDLEELREELSSTAKNSTLSTAQASKLREIMHGIRKTLDAEIEGFEAFVVTPKRLDIKKLLDDIPSLLAPDIFELLPDIAKYDLTEAGKCIAFERPTAAAFHLLRGTEATIRHFYDSAVKQDKVSPKLWGNMVDDLRKRKKTKRYSTLYSNLDNIRISY